MLSRKIAVVVLAALSAFACSSAGPYGFSRVYEPLSEEEDFAEDAKEFDPVMVEREPETWKQTKLSLFGVVRQRKQATGGAAYLTLGVRTLSKRNACDTAADDSCRVTVSEREHAVVHAIVTLRPEDTMGPGSVRPGSLVRVIGKLTDDVDRDNGAPVLEAGYYRHWPMKYFVTDVSRAHMTR